jgi:hypothetical protein
MHTTRSTPCYLKSSALSMKLRGERARNGKQHDTFAGEQVVKVSRPSGPATLKVASGRRSPLVPRGHLTGSPKPGQGNYFAVQSV